MSQAKEPSDLLITSPSPFIAKTISTSRNSGGTGSLLGPSPATSIPWLFARSPRWEAVGGFASWIVPAGVSSWVSDRLGLLVADSQYEPFTGKGQHPGGVLFPNLTRVVTGLNPVGVCFDRVARVTS